MQTTFQSVILSSVCKCQHFVHGPPPLSNKPPPPPPPPPEKHGKGQNKQESGNFVALKVYFIRVLYTSNIDFHVRKCMGFIHVLYSLFMFFAYEDVLLIVSVFKITLELFSKIRKLLASEIRKAE